MSGVTSPVLGTEYHVQTDHRQLQYTRHQAECTDNAAALLSYFLLKRSWEDQMGAGIQPGQADKVRELLTPPRSMHNTCTE